MGDATTKHGKEVGVGVLLVNGEITPPSIPATKFTILGRTSIFALCALEL
jgi:hypothetical protein